MSVADVYQDERLRLMPNPRPFDGYIEHPARVSSTSLISFQRNRYSVPCEWVTKSYYLCACTKVKVPGLARDLLQAVEDVTANSSTGR